MSRQIIDACASCSKSVRYNQRGIYCDLCKRWLHLSCTSYTFNEYQLLSTTTEDWYCQFCLAYVFPLNKICDEFEYLNCIFNLSHSVKLSSNHLLTNFQLALSSKRLGSNSDIDPDYNCIRQYCKDSPYYLDTEFNDLIDKKTVYLTLTFQSCISIYAVFKIKSLN